MATNYAAKLKSTNEGGLANATDIAYSVTTRVDLESGETIETMSLSIKDKIDEIATNGAMYDENTTLREKVAELVDSGITIDAATDAANEAEAALEAVKAQKTLIDDLTQTRLNQVNSSASTLELYYAELILLLSNINSAVNEFRTSFEVDKDFAVVSETYYNNLSSELKNNGTIYFIYE